MKKRVCVFGHRGLVGSAVVRRFRREDGFEVVTTNVDLERPDEVDAFFRESTAVAPFDVVVIAAAKVGGILANASAPVDFLTKNLAIQTNVLMACHRYRRHVTRTIFLGSSCVYPKEAAQPLTEDLLMTGPLEDTNKAYAMAKLCGIELCEALKKQHAADVVALMPCNLYGPNDRYDRENAHVIPALIEKFATAVAAAEQTTVVAWGTGEPLREFLHVDDLAEAIRLVAMHPAGFERVVYNVGSREEISTRALAELLRTISGFDGGLEFDVSKPDGTMRKVLCCDRFSSVFPDWKPLVSLEDGLRRVYEEKKKSM